MKAREQRTERKEVRRAQTEAGGAVESTERKLTNLLPAQEMK